MRTNANARFAYWFILATVTLLNIFWKGFIIASIRCTARCPRPEKTTLKRRRNARSHRAGRNDHEPGTASREKAGLLPEDGAAVLRDGARGAPLHHGAPAAAFPGGNFLFQDRKLLRIVLYPGATHSFTNPEADEYAKKFNLPIAYDPEADRDSWKQLKEFLKSIFKLQTATQEKQ